MASRYADMFARLDAANEGAFVPFVMVADPDLATSELVIQQLINSGADALELGIPYSDPIADGPTIQASAIRALSNKVSVADCLAVIKRIRAANADVPIGLLLYSNLVMAQGIDNFYAQCADAGVDSILIADIPLREIEPFMQVAKQHGIEQILIAPPNANEQTLKAIAEKSQGYTYLLGRAGVTGTETAAQTTTHPIIKELANYQIAPPLLGFGISTPAQVSDAIRSGAAGAISGSATVKLVEQHLNEQDAMLAALANFVTDMKAATKKG